MDRWATMLSDYNYEFWIGKYDYRLMRLSVKGWYDTPDHGRADFTVSTNLTKFNVAQAIDRPTNNVQEFNLRQLLDLPLATP